ncbi:MAG: SIS domain-containing protein [Anaerolineaceae bacterium]|jgi:uncharacterized phosphosugar-binding protein|nr:SIS domain-containing protein [Anaerolineaceae bacterium]
MKNMAGYYAAAVQDLLTTISTTQEDNIQAAARLISDAVAGDGIIYTFGTGHSHVIAEDVAYRAGGLAPVDAILEPSLTGHQQVYKSEYMERVEGMAEVILNYYEVSPKDVLVVISNSGRNAAPIEMASIAQARGIPVIAITSLAHSTGTTSRHSSGDKLYQHADVVIDNHCPRGDCLLQIPDLAQPIGPGSGITGMFILHSIIVQAIQNLVEAGVEAPVLRSGNLDESEAFNKTILDKYKGRIKLW